MKLKTTGKVLSTLGFLCVMTVFAKNEPLAMNNPFTETAWNTPFEVPAFDKIEVEHYLPAIEAGIAEQTAEIDAIVSNKMVPSYQNTLAAYDGSGVLLEKVTSVVFNQYSADSTPEMMELAKEMMPLLSAHNASIKMNGGLFEKIRILWEKKDSLDLEVDELKFLDDTYRSFVRGGALLNDSYKARAKAIQTELASLTLEFGQNVINDTNGYQIIVDSKSELEGLSESIVNNAAQKATDAGLEGKYLFIANRATVEPVTTFGKHRALREKLYKGYVECADRGNEFDNNTVIKKIVDLRIELSHLLGFENWTAYALDSSMAENVDQVLDLSLKVWEPAKKTAAREVAEMQALIDAEGGNFKLAPWDYRYYAEKIRIAKYDLSEAQIKPYFELGNVRNGVFQLAEKLYGIKISKREDIPVYNEDVDAWEVTEADGTHIGVFLTDYLVRPTKKAGAWMSAYRGQNVRDGEFITPVIVNVCNFPRPTADQPTLLSLDEVTTMFHEFGHGLHGLLSHCRIGSQAGTSVPTDFVELPSMVHENWALEPEMLKSYAFHYETGDVIPEALIEKIKKTKTFNQGFYTVEYTAAVLLDLAYHARSESIEGSVVDFENEVLAETYGLNPEIAPRYRSTYFQHIFAGGYSSKYYAYLWSEVLDADAYEKFKEDGIFNRGTAQSFRDNVLSKGGSEDSMKLYLKFRGHQPNADPLLKRRGFL